MSGTSEFEPFIVQGLDSWKNMSSLMTARPISSKGFVIALGSNLAHTEERGGALHGFI